MIVIVGRNHLNASGFLVVVAFTGTRHHQHAVVVRRLVRVEGFWSRQLLRSVVTWDLRGGGVVMLWHSDVVMVVIVVCVMLMGMVGL